jgi:hypothetical protein
METVKKMKAKDLCEKYIYKNQTSLVEYVLETDAENAPFYDSDIENLWIPIYAADDLIELWPDEYEEYRHEKDGFDSFLAYLADRSYIRYEHLYHEQHIHQWWSVDSWLARRLEAKGEAVLITEVGCWWGKSGTGYANEDESAIIEIAKEMEDATG